MSRKDEKDNKVDCFKCQYFAITWDSNFPRACKLYGFKSAGIPSMTVFKASGAKCMGFAPKETKA